MKKNWIGRRMALSALAIIPAIVVVLTMLPQDVTFPESQWISAAQAANSESTEPRLLLGFADRSGIYLANIRVVITDEMSKPIASLVVDGPWLALGLDPGIYNISASFEGRKLELRNLQLSERGTTTRVLYWDLNVAPNQIMAERQADQNV